MVSPKMVPSVTVQHPWRQGVTIIAGCEFYWAYKNEDRSAVYRGWDRAVQGCKQVHGWLFIFLLPCDKIRARRGAEEGRFRESAALKDLSCIYIYNLYMWYIADRRRLYSIEGGYEIRHRWISQSNYIHRRPFSTLSPRNICIYRCISYYIPTYCMNTCLLVFPAAQWVFWGISNEETRIRCEMEK